MKKRILLIAMKLYHQEFIKELEKLNYEVTYYNDKPNDGVICKTFGRLQTPLYQIILTRYYKRIVDNEKNKKFDYIFILRGEYAPPKALGYLRNTFTNSKFILYMWDSIKNNKNVEQKWKYFDKVYSFDSLDCDKYEQLTLLPLFYIDEYSNNSESKKYDIAFVGTGHGDRPKIIKNVQDFCKQNNLTFYSYIYLPHKLIFFKNKIFNKDYKNIKMSDIHFKLLEFNKIAKIYSSSKCVLDIESQNQSGLTMRTIETLGSQRKLITTNNEIIRYDLYDSQNVFIIDRSNIILNKDFIVSSYKQLDKKIYEKYTLKNWFKTMLEE